MEERVLHGALSALKQVLELRDGENALVVTDRATLPVGEAFRAAAESLGARTAWFVLPEEQRPLAEVPEDLEALIPDVDVAVTCFEGRAEETPFRIALLKSLIRVARRVGHAPGITEEMLREGPMQVDHDALAMAAGDLMDRLEDAVSVLIQAPGGTDLRLGIAGRPFATDTLVADGHWGNLPCGEIWCAPVEDEADGVLVCDGSIGDLGAVPAPVRLLVSRGQVTEVQCPDEAFAARVREVLAVDPGASRIGEFGIGLNPGARVTGNLLEDEKALRTIHVAFGNNMDMGGGRNESKTHRDFLVLGPTVEVTFEDGRTERVMVGGEIVPRNRPRNPAEPHRFHHLLVAVDYSDASVEALRLADHLARRDDARLTVCHVLPMPAMVSPLFPHYVAMPDTETHRASELNAAERLEQLVRENTPRSPEAYQILVLWGDAASRIIEVAEQKGADLLVLANRGTGGLARWALGSVAAHVAAHARCPVLLVR